MDATSSPNLLTLAEVATAEKSEDLNPQPLGRSIFDRPFRPLPPRPLSPTSLLRKIKRSAYDRKRRIEFNSMKSQIDQLLAERATLAAALDQSNTTTKGLLDSTMGLMSLVKAYALVTAGCPRCTSGMEFLVSPAHQLLGPVPPPEATAASSATGSAPN